MKNILLILSFLITGIVLFSSCNPTKDFTDEYSKFNNPSKVKFADSVTVYTLTSADYLNSSVTDISKNKYFSAAFPADPNILEILNKKYNAKIAASLTIVSSYNNPLTLRDSVSYTLLNADYGNTYYDFTKVTDLYTYLSKTYPLATRGKVAILTYNWLTKTSVVTNSFVYLGNKIWIVITPFASTEYTAMGQSYPDFSNTTDPLYNIPLYLKIKYPFAKSGDSYLVQYAVTSKLTQYQLQFTYNGSAWLAFTPLTTATTVVSFDGLLWKFPPPVKAIFSTDATNANAIPYTLISADYRLVGNSYDDFQRNIVGSYEEPDAIFLGKMSTILKTRYPATITIGQIYAVTYGDYAGTTVPKTVYLQIVAL